MKKKNTILIIVLLFSIILFFVLYTTFSNGLMFDRTIYIFKHIAYFLLMSSVLITVLFGAYLLIYPKYTDMAYNPVYLKLFTLLTFTIILVVLTNTRINYIKNYETPIVEDFIIYDNYSNRIYTGILRENEPNIEIINNDEYYLELNITEATSVVYPTYSYNNKTYNEVPFTINILSSIKISYNEDYKITNFEFRREWINSFEISDEIINQQYSRYLKVINHYNMYDNFVSERYYYENTSEELFEGFYDFSESDFGSVIIGSYLEDSHNVLITSDTTTLTGGESSFEIDMYLEYSYMLNAKVINYTYHRDGYENFIDEYGVILLNNDYVSYTNNAPYDYSGYQRNYTEVDNLMLMTEFKSNYSNTYPNLQYNHYLDEDSIYIIRSNDEAELDYYEITKLDFGYMTTKYKYINYTRGLDFDFDDYYNTYVFTIGVGSNTSLDYLDYTNMLLNYYSFNKLIYEYNPLYDFEI